MVKWPISIFFFSLISTISIVLVYISLFWSCVTLLLLVIQVPTHGIGLSCGYTSELLTSLAPLMWLSRLPPLPLNLVLRWRWPLQILKSAPILIDFYLYLVRKFTLHVLLLAAPSLNGIVVLAKLWYFVFIFELDLSCNERFFWLPFALRLKFWICYLITKLKEVFSCNISWDLFTSSKLCFLFVAFIPGINWFCHVNQPPFITRPMKVGFPFGWNVFKFCYVVVYCVLDNLRNLAPEYCSMVLKFNYFLRIISYAFVSFCF